MRVLVATITHRADDARIFARQIPALLDAGHDVTAVAPWRASGVVPDARVRAVDVPRARGRDRLTPLRRAMAALQAHHGNHDVVLVHDPELALACALVSWRDRVIWDVHEDPAASISTRSYLPAPMRRLAPSGVRAAERWIESRLHLILAERAYAQRFARPHPVVLNLPTVPVLANADLQQQIVYVGSLTWARGVRAMLATAEALEAHGIRVVLIGEAHGDDVRQSITRARNVDWRGPQSNAAALSVVRESLAGLSLLADEPNYRHSMPTKVLEYMAQGTLVISTPLPLAVDVLGGEGVIVPFDATGEQIAAEVVALRDDVHRRSVLRTAAHERVARSYNWDVAQAGFVEALAAVADR